MGVIVFSVEPLELAPDERLDNEAIASCNNITVILLSIQ